MAIDNKDNKVLNVPHLRFPEFSGEWEMVSLSRYSHYKSKNQIRFRTLLFI